MPKLYAVGIGEWVELREGERPPRPFTTEVTKNIKTEKIVSYSYHLDEPCIRPIKTPFVKKFKLKTTVHLGGKVVGTLKMDKFVDIMGFYVPNGATRIVPSDYIGNLLKESALNAK